MKRKQIPCKSWNGYPGSCRAGDDCAFHHKVREEWSHGDDDHAPRFAVGPPKLKNKRVEEPLPPLPQNASEQLLLAREKTLAERLIAEANIRAETEKRLAAEANARAAEARRLTPAQISPCRQSTTQIWNEILGIIDTKPTPLDKLLPPLVVLKTWPDFQLDGPFKEEADLQRALDAFFTPKYDQETHQRVPQLPGAVSDCVQHDDDLCVRAIEGFHFDNMTQFNGYDTSFSKTKLLFAGAIIELKNDDIYNESSKAVNKDLFVQIHGYATKILQKSYHRSHIFALGTNGVSQGILVKFPQPYSPEKISWSLIDHTKQGTFLVDILIRLMYTPQDFLSGIMLPQLRVKYYKPGELDQQDCEPVLLGESLGLGGTSTIFTCQMKGRAGDNTGVLKCVSSYPATSDRWVLPLFQECGLTQGVPQLIGVCNDDISVVTKEVYYGAHAIENADSAVGLITVLRKVHHKCRVIHRDIRPPNIMWSTAGFLVLNDWGFACKVGNPVDPLSNITFQSERMLGLLAKRQRLQQMWKHNIAYDDLQVVFKRRDDFSSLARSILWIRHPVVHDTIEAIGSKQNIEVVSKAWEYVKAMKPEFNAFLTAGESGNYKQLRTLLSEGKV